MRNLVLPVLRLPVNASRNSHPNSPPSFFYHSWDISCSISLFFVFVTSTILPKSIFMSHYLCFLHILARFISHSYLSFVFCSLLVLEFPWGRLIYFVVFSVSCLLSSVHHFLWVSEISLDKHHTHPKSMGQLAVSPDRLRCLASRQREEITSERVTSSEVMR